MNRHFAAIVAPLVITLGAFSYGLYAVFAQAPYLPPKRTAAILIVRNPPALDAVEENFVDRMRQLGYAEGDNAAYTRIEVGSDLASTEERVAEALDASEIDLVFAMGVIAARAAKDVTAERGAETPVVFGVVSDPVGVGLVENITRSGNNMTGVTPANEVTASKRVELLKEVLPGIKRIVYIWNDKNTSGVERLRQVAAAADLEIVEREVANVPEMISTLGEQELHFGDAIMRTSDGVGAGALLDVIRIAIENKVPLVGTNSGDTKKGALMSFGADYGDIGRASARLADLILRGVKPTDIPIEEASRFEISVNLDTAKKIGVTVPQPFLLKTNIVVPQN